MTKILLTENQLQMIKNQLVKEDMDNRYRREVDVRIYIFGSTFKGNEINDVSANERVTVSFLIDVDHRSWGVKDISLYHIRGEQTLNVMVDYYINENGDSESEYMDINLDWDKLETEKIQSTGMITVGDTLEITLMNDENGNLVVKSMTIEVYSL